MLISTLPWVEVWFDGIDRAAIWHRRVAMIGLLLLLPHILLSSGDGGGGSLLGLIGLLGLIALVVWAVLPRWQSVVPRPLRGLVGGLAAIPGIRQFRRVFGATNAGARCTAPPGCSWPRGSPTGCSTARPSAPPQSCAGRWWPSAAPGWLYVYREVLARFFLSLHDYQVQSVDEVGPGLVEISLRPLGRGMRFVPGQFAMIYLEGKDGWHRHPFTIASAPSEELLRVTVKALGDYTSRLAELIEPGMPAVVGGPHGRFSHNRGADHQIWIAGGVGVAPFLSWLRALDEHPIRHVDFFYTTDGPAPFADEITAIGARYDGLNTHLIDTEATGRLTTQQVFDTVGEDPRALSVFLCGPAPMLRTFQTGLRSAGVPARRIHREYFDWR